MESSEENSVNKGELKDLINTWISTKEEIGDLKHQLKLKEDALKPHKQEVKDKQATCKQLEYQIITEMKGHNIPSCTLSSTGQGCLVLNKSTKRRQPTKQNWKDGIALFLQTYKIDANLDDVMGFVHSDDTIAEKEELKLI